MTHSNHPHYLMAFLEGMKEVIATSKSRFHGNLQGEAVIFEPRVYYTRIFSHDIAVLPPTIQSTFVAKSQSIMSYGNNLLLAKEPLFDFDKDDVVGAATEIFSSKDSGEGQLVFQEMMEWWRPQLKQFFEDFMQINEETQKSYLEIFFDELKIKDETLQEWAVDIMTSFALSFSGSYSIFCAASEQDDVNKNGFYFVYRIYYWMNDEIKPFFQDLIEKKHNEDKASLERMVTRFADQLPITSQLSFSESADFFINMIYKDDEAMKFISFDRKQALLRSLFLLAREAVLNELPNNTRLSVKQQAERVVTKKWFSTFTLKNARNDIVSRRNNAEEYYLQRAEKFGEELQTLAPGLQFRGEAVPSAKPPSPAEFKSVHSSPKN